MLQERSLHVLLVSPLRMVVHSDWWTA